MPFTSPNPMIARRTVLALAALAPALAALPAAAAGNVAEVFVNDNIHKGMDLLNNRSLSAAQKRDQFESFLLGLADLKRIALFSLGHYRNGANPAELDAFTAAFQNYAIATYQTYFARYAGQTLKVINSTEVKPTDFRVTTQLVDPNDRSGQPPAEVVFRIRTDTGKPVLVDVSYEGVWVSLSEQAMCTGFLDQNKGSLPGLVTELNRITNNLRNGK